MKSITLKLGDPCPHCGTPFAEVPQPTPEQRSAATRRDDPIALPATVDTATPEQRAELGALFVCPRCGYRARLLPPKE